MKYFVSHNVDQLGGRYENPLNPEGPFTLAEAHAREEELTAAGRCGVVLDESGAIEAPDGTWLLD